MWTPTWAMLADYLTKVLPSHELREILNRGTITMVMNKEDVEKKEQDSNEAFHVETNTITQACLDVLDSPTSGNRNFDG